MMHESLDRWFAYEVLPHEASLTEWLSGFGLSWHEIHQFRQETYVCTYKAAAISRLAGAQALLMARAVEVTRAHGYTQELLWPRREPQTQRARLPEDLTPNRCVGAYRQLCALAEAFDHLPSPYREVVWARRVEDCSQKEVGTRLRVAKPVIERYVAHAARRLADGIFGADYLYRQQSVADSELRSDCLKLEVDAAKTVARADWVDGLDQEEALELACSDASIAYRVAYIRVDAAWRQTRRLKAIVVSGVPLDECPAPGTWRYPGF